MMVKTIRVKLHFWLITQSNSHQYLALIDYVLIQEVVHAVLGRYFLIVQAALWNRPSRVACLMTVIACCESTVMEEHLVCLFKKNWMWKSCEVGKRNLVYLSRENLVELSSLYKCLRYVLPVSSFANFHGLCYAILQCMCRECAKELRLKSNKCPICRQTIEELLEIKVNNGTKQRNTSQWISYDLSYCLTFQLRMFHCFFFCLAASSSSSPSARSWFT